MNAAGLVAPYWSDVTKDELTDIARLAEDSGYDSIWVPEMWGRDAFSILALLALNTSVIRLATGIVPVFSRTPAVLAQTAATLDEFSGGRLILGLGSSGSAVIEKWHGLKFDKPLQRTREYVEIIKLILGYGRADYHGEIFELNGFRLQFKPVREDLPVYIAAMGPRNIRLAGEVADGWIPFLIPPDEIASLMKELDAGAASAGRDPGSLKVRPYIVACVSEDGSAARKYAARHIAHYVGAMGKYYFDAMKRYGFGEEASNIKKCLDSGSASKAAGCVSESMLDALSVSGTPAKAGSLLRKLCETIDSPVFIFPPKAPREVVLQTIRSLAPGVRN